MPVHTPNTGACVTELAAMMLQLLSSQDKVRRVGDRNRGAMPYVSPAALLLELGFCSGGFPKLQVEEGKWSDVGIERVAGAMLFRMTTYPGSPAAYVVVQRDGYVRRVPVRRRAR